MFYFICAVTFIALFNLLFATFFIWRFGLDGVRSVFFKDDEEPNKETPLNRSH